MIFTCPHCNVRVNKGDVTCPTCSRDMVRRCPACAEHVSVIARECKYCGEMIPAAVADPAARRVPAAPAPEIEFLGETRYVRWEDRKSAGVFARWWSTWWSSMFDSANFWKRTPTDSGHLKAIAYAWFPVAQLLMLALPLFVIAGVAHASGAAMVACGHGYGPVEAAAAYLALYPLTFAAVAASVWGRAALWHVPLKLLGARGSFQTTSRIVAYNSGWVVMNALPGVGTLVGFVQWHVMKYQALRHAHQMTKGRAIVAVALPLVFIGGLVAAAFYTGCAQEAFDHVKRHCPLGGC